jgi:hypothetical protein
MHHWDDFLLVGPAGQFRDDTTIITVYGILACNDVGKQGSTLRDGCRCFIAGRFNAKDTDRLLRHGMKLVIVLFVVKSTKILKRPVA